MMYKILPFFLLFLVSELSAQTVQNFTVTDYNNVEHNLYQDYLNQGKTVVIKFFFTSCPPCQAQAPTYEALYQDWGAGQYDVEFMEISDKAFDNNSSVSNYASIYGTTMPGIGNDGGGLAAISQFTSGTYGPYFGTPTYCVIYPNGTVDWDVAIFNLDNAISDSGATGSGIETAQYTLNVINPTGQQVDFSNAQVIMGSLGDPTYALDIQPYLINASFTYPSDDIPEVLGPTLKIIDNTGTTNASSALDLILIQKHLLQTQTFTNPYHILAADINNSNNLSAIDLIELQKVILGIFNNFPNNDLKKFYFQDCNDCLEYALPFQADANYNLPIVRVVIGDVN